MDVLAHWLCSTWDERLFTSSNDDDDDDGCGSWHYFQATGLLSSPSFDRLKDAGSSADVVAITPNWPMGLCFKWNRAATAEEKMNLQMDTIAVRNQRSPRDEWEAVSFCSFRSNMFNLWKLLQTGPRESLQIKRESFLFSGLLHFFFTKSW